jgi:CBS domain-containing protein
LWIAFIGWFLLDASRSSYAQVELMHVLRGVKVRDVMDRDCAPVDAKTSLRSLVYEHSLLTGKRCFVVEENGHLAGLITTADIGRIGRDRWEVTTVEQAMKPLHNLHTVSPDAPVAQALETMARENVNQLPVVTDGHLEGILSRAHLLQVLQTRVELSV